MKSVINSSSSFILLSWSLLLLLLSHSVVVFSTLNSEGEALLSLQNKFFSADDNRFSSSLDWNNLSSSSSSTPCEWEGIVCNTEKTHVVSLNLSDYGIYNSQLGPQIGQLTYLKSLDLTRNNFNGSIPIELWNCSHLQYLDLSDNSFSGKLPEAVKNLHQLNFLSISRNQLGGRIPVSLFQNSGLKTVFLGGNNFTGSIPTELWNCSHLQHLDLSSNHFTGEFPHEAMRNLHQLKTVSISKNQFSGRIPEEYLFQNSGLEDVDLSYNIFSGSIPVNIGNATNLRNLYLMNNQLHGAIPTSISNCTKLEILDLSNNGGLSGGIPLGVWRIPTLVRIDVSKNNLSGELPPTEMTTGLHLLEVITLSENKFFGSVPKDLGINNTNLNRIDFSNNVFTGEIPPNLCFGQKLTDMMFNQNQLQGNIPSAYTTGNYCDSLTALSLQGNKLNGSFPRHFGQNMQILDLSRNKIHGQISSSSICSLIDLTQLDLSENQMNGTVPRCLADLYKLVSLNLRNNDFSGTIPPEFKSLKLYMLDLNGNRFEGKIPRLYSPKLTFVDLGNNQLQDTFPFFFFSKDAFAFPYLMEILPLQTLVLRSNKLYGPLNQYPNSRYLAPTSLKILDISSNYFSGNLPLEFKFIFGLEVMKNIDRYQDSLNVQHVYYPPTSSVVIHKGIELRLNNTMMSTFRAIDMSNNSFQGSIPESIGGELLFLTSLNLSNNNLNGRIPWSLGNLTRLESLDLSKNKLFGEIPEQLTNLSFLGVLNLSHNNLTGHIPTAGQFQTYPNSSFDGNPGLCGLQSSTGCGGGSHHRDPVVEKESNKDSNSWNFGWEPVVIGYGCGVLIGLILQYFIFTKASMYRWFG